MPANGLTGPQHTFAIPQISQDDLFAFYQSHFSSEALTNFDQNFMNPALPPAPLPHDSHGTQSLSHGEEEDEEDDLGYYEDGVKRTLTDEQIEIFRHSELRELRRQQERSSDLPANGSEQANLQASGSGALLDVCGSKKKKKKKKSPPKREPKPDLRKRTWDVVEAGLDTLDYD